jgi:hypothetical protein
MDQREHPRNRQEGLVGLEVIVVPVEGRAAHGRLVDMSARGASVTMEASERPKLAEAGRVVLVIGANQLDPPVTASAVTLHQTEVGEERRVGFRFVDPEALMETLSGSFRVMFNARQAERVKAEAHAPIMVAVCLPLEGGGQTEPVDGELGDISVKGLSLELPVEVDADAITEGVGVRLMVRLPGVEGALPLTGIVRDCVPLGDRWRVGLEFTPESMVDFEASHAGIVAYIESRRAEDELP